MSAITEAKQTLKQSEYVLGNKISSAIQEILNEFRTEHGVVPDSLRVTLCPIAELGRGVVDVYVETEVKL